MAEIPSLGKIEKYTTKILKRVKELEAENKKLRKEKQFLSQKLKKAEENLQLNNFDNIEVKKLKQENLELKKSKNEAREKVEEMLSKFEELEL